MKLVPGSDSSLLKLGRRRLTSFITSLLLVLFIPAVSLFLSGCGLLLAVTDPDEDIAETMMMFILNDKPNGRNMAEQKILFLYEFPELMELRDEMRSVLNDYNLTATPGLNSVMVSI
jgi:hypothetical protein